MGFLAPRFLLRIHIIQIPEKLKKQGGNHVGNFIFSPWLPDSNYRYGRDLQKIIPLTKLTKYSVRRVNQKLSK